MPPIKNLDVKSIEALKPREAPYRVSDGGGLLIEVRPTGAKAWLCRLTVNGKRRDMGLGGYPLVSLAAARAAATEARRLAREGTDPIGQREAIAASQLAELAARSEAESRTFRRVANACIKSQAPGWKNKRTADLWLNSLEKYAFPDLGDMPVGDIGPKEILKAVGTVWATRPATAKKVLRRIGTALRFAAAHGWRANDNPTDVRMLRHAGLPALQGGRKQPSLPWPKAPAFIKALRLVDGIAPLALHFCILTTVRSGEVRGARWSEMSFDDGITWAITGERMKGKKSADVQPHRIPLSPAAVSVLLRAYTLVTGTAATKETLPRLATLQRDALIFPTPSKSKTPLSDAALSAVMLRMNANCPVGVAAPWCDPDGRKAVPHGWRATFRTWVDDTRPEDTVAAERALAHEDSNKVSGAYRRSDLFDRRKPLMEAWAEHCESIPKDRGVNGSEPFHKFISRVDAKGLIASDKKQEEKPPPSDERDAIRLTPDTKYIEHGWLEQTQSIEEWNDMVSQMITQAKLMSYDELLALAAVVKRDPKARGRGAPNKDQRLIQAATIMFYDRKMSGKAVPRIEAISMIAHQFRIEPDAARKVYKGAMKIVSEWERK